jgi:hypothetical protein
MSKRKINYNRPVPDRETVRKHQDFEQVLKQVSVVPKPFIKSIGFWGAVGSSVIALTLVSYQYLNATKNKNAYDATSTLAVNTAPLPEDTKCISAINKELDHEFETFAIDPADEHVLSLKGGAVIAIPQYAFNTESDATITIKARVFRDKSEAYGAGIPMDYGKHHAFESAGMIEIRGIQNGKEVKLKADKEIEITLGLHKSPEDFDFYMLDEAKGDWDKYEAIINTDREVEPRSSELKQLELDLQSGLITEDKLRSSIKQIRMPSKTDFMLAENEKQVFELRFNKFEFPALKAFDNIQFEAQCKQQTYKQLLDETWSDVKLSKFENRGYVAVFSSSSGIKEINVTPVLTGQEAKQAFKEYTNRIQQISIEKAIQEDKLKEIESQNKKRQEKIDSLNRVHFEENSFDNRVKLETERKAMIYRKRLANLKQMNLATATFKTSRWGVFNSDRPVKYPEIPEIPYSIASTGQDIELHEVHVFDLEKDVRYTFGTRAHPIETLSLKNNKTVIIANDKFGNMSYIKLNGKSDIQNGVIQLTPIKKGDSNLDFFKNLLDEKRGRISA